MLIGVVDVLAVLGLVAVFRIARFQILGGPVCQCLHSPRQWKVTAIRMAVVGSEWRSAVVGVQHKRHGCALPKTPSCVCIGVAGGAGGGGGLNDLLIPVEVRVVLWFDLELLKARLFVLVLHVTLYSTCSIALRNTRRCDIPSTLLLCVVGCC